MAAKRGRKNQGTAPPPTEPERFETLAGRHLRAGWWLLLLFLILGIVLESLHGFKVAWYLRVGQETRRLLWRLAHAHGTFLALVNIAFAATLWMKRPQTNTRISLASACLLSAAILVPAGFFLGGTIFYDGDPGAGVILLPIGAVLLLLAVGLTAWSLRR